MSNINKLQDYIKVTNGDLFNHIFQPALTKLFRCDTFTNPKSLYWLARLEKDVREHMREQQLLLEKTRKQYLDKDEDGKVVFKDKKAWDAFEKEFSSVELETKVFKLKLDQLEGCKLSPSEVNILEPIITLAE